MKKILLIILLPLLSFQSFSQNDTDAKREIKGTKKTQFGIRSGLNYSFLSGNLVELLDSRFAYHVGGYIQIPVNEKKFLLEVGSFYSLEGVDNSLLYGDKIQQALELPSIGNLAPTILKLDYLDFQFILKDNQSEKFSAFGGIEFSYLLGSEIEQEYVNEDNVVQKYSNTNISGLSNSAIGIIIGLEYHVNRLLHVNAQYTHALTRVIKDSSTDVKNSVIKLSVGFTF